MTQSAYFGGSKVRDGIVRRLQANNFKEVVERYFNVPIQFPMTRTDFLAHPDRDTIKDVPYIVPCTYPFEEGKRENSTADKLTLVILDLDEGAFVKDFFEAPETVSEALYPYNHIVYCTAKHTTDSPRLRIIVPVLPCDVKVHKRLVAHIAKRLGIPFDFKGHRESNVLSQPAYRPMQFQGEEFTAVISTRTSGQSLDPADAPEIDAKESDDRTYACEFDEGAVSLAYLPIHGLKMSDIREPLFAVDADCNYRVWTEIASSLRHQFTDEDDAREAYEVFDEWSAQGTKYKGDKETFGKWRSFKPHATGRNPITIRTLFKHAMDSGWENTKIATKVKQGIVEWMNACTDGDLLMHEGAKRISQLPFKNEMVEEALVVALRKRVQELCGTLIDKATIKRQVNNARFKAKAEENSVELESWLRPICFITSRNTFQNVANGVEYSPPAFDNTFSEFLMPTDADSEMAKAGRPSILPVHHALNVRKIKKVDGVTYDPRHGGEEPFFRFEGKDYLNEYRISSAPRELPEFEKEAKAAWRKLLGHLIAHSYHEQLLTDFIAYVIQHPGEKIRWAAIIQSCQGAGKGTVGDIIIAALGPPNVNIIAPGAMSSDFNSWRYGSQVVIFDELKSPGHNKQEVSNKLKDAITNTRVSLNQKNRDPRVIINVTNFIAFTNFKDCIHVEDSDRRYFFVESPLQYKHQLQGPHVTKIFDDVHSLIETKPGAFRSFFMNHKISEDFPVNGPAPETDFRREIIQESKNPLHLAIEALVENPSIPTITSDVIFEEDLFVLTEKERRNNNKPSHYLRMMGYERWNAGEKFTINGKRGGVWVHGYRYAPETGDPVDLLTQQVEQIEKEI